MSSEILRAGADETAAELRKNFAGLFPDARLHILHPSEVALLWGTQKAPWSQSFFYKGGVVIFIPISSDQSRVPVSGIMMEFGREITERESMLIDRFSKVFNTDVWVAPKFQQNQELWVTLQQTRHSRAIARFARFPTDHFLRWLRSFESATNLRYEGRPFSSTLIISTNIDHIKNKRNVSFVKFGNGIPLTKALFEEKWIRALSYGGSVSLVALGLDRGIVGAACLEEKSNSVANFPPHESLSNLCATIGKGMVSFVASERGDTYVIFSDGVRFLKTQGRWHFIDPSIVLKYLTGIFDIKVADSILRTIFDLSYDRQGALISIPSDENSIEIMIPDHSIENRTNMDLRLFSRRLDITNPQHRRMLRSILAIDGAVVVSKNGRVLDSACMIATPADEKLRKLNKKREVFPGARTTAAWNASLHGVAIQVSEDGPITFWQNGVIDLRVG